MPFLLVPAIKLVRIPPFISLLFVLSFFFFSLFRTAEWIYYARATVARVLGKFDEAATYLQAAEVRFRLSTFSLFPLLDFFPMTSRRLLVLLRVPGSPNELSLQQGIKRFKLCHHDRHISI